VRVLALCTDLCRGFPEVCHATLHARVPVEGNSGSVEVVLWNNLSGIGVVANVPAEIAEPGSVTIPTHMTATVLAAMPQSRLHLSSIIVSDPAPISDEEQIKPLKGGPALQIEGTSETGTTQRARLRLCTPTPEHTVFPALAIWQASGIPLATIAPNKLRETLKPCVLLARERAQAFYETSGMDHALVLLRFDSHALVCTATTQTAVAQSTLPWTMLPGEAPFLHTLIDEGMLRWIMNALKGETHPITLTLVPQEASAALLLFALPHITLVCRGKTAPIPLVWEQRVNAPASQALLLSRALLIKALDFLAVDGANHPGRCLLLNVVGHRLCLQWDPLVPEDHAALCQIPIVNTAAESEPVLVHLRQTRRMIRQIKGPAICLEQGIIVLRKSKEEASSPVPIGFVRFSKPGEATTRMMMAISEHTLSPLNTHPTAEREPESLKKDEEGAALATV
jgi:hypothetical protein